MDKYYLELDEEGLRRIAAAHFGACDDGSHHPRDLRWTLDPEFELEKLLACIAAGDREPHPLSHRDRWISYFHHECDMLADELDGVREWDVLAEEEINEPIVISIDGDKIQIWDGWHRTAGSITAGRKTIPAIIGRP